MTEAQTYVETFLRSSKERVESFFKDYFSNQRTYTLPLQWSRQLQSGGIQKVREAMLYSLEAGGKRLRPALVYATLQACGKDMALGDPAAAAVEMIHTYSLIHDDLPCMDDDDLRRGRPTCHKKYDEATAVLAGDGLLTEAMTLLVHPKTVALWGAKTAADVSYDLGLGAGYVGMVGGQSMDLVAEGKRVDQAHLESIHRSKTGALIRAAVRMGALIAHATEDNLARLTRYAEALGLAFQVADDVLDQTQDSATLGKTAGKDLAAEKATYPSLMGVDAARHYADSLASAAIAEVQPFGKHGEILSALASFTVARKS